MDTLQFIQGEVITQPEYSGTHTSFVVRTDDQCYCIVRLDPVWQKRDILFLNIGQTVCVSGQIQAESDTTILAREIQIIGHPHCMMEEEKENDIEAF